MKANPLPTYPDKSINAWAVLVIPVIGLLMAVLLLDFIIATDPIWAKLVGLINSKPSIDWRYFATWIVMEVLVFLPILAISGGLIWLTNWIPLLQPIAHHVCRDWSLLSFLLYGVACLPIMLTGDEYRGLATYQLGSLALLVGGALMYLRPAKAWPHLWGLLAALGMAFGLLALGVYLVYPQQTWANLTPFPRWHETVSPLISAITLGLLMLAPAVVELLPNKSGPVIE